jgi:hypothetical protein
MNLLFAKSPVYVNSLFVTCGSRFVATKVLVIDRTGDEYCRDEIFDMINRIPESLQLSAIWEVRTAELIVTPELKVTVHVVCVASVAVPDVNVSLAVPVPVFSCDAENVVVPHPLVEGAGSALNAKFASVKTILSPMLSAPFNVNVYDTDCAVTTVGLLMDKLLYVTLGTGGPGAAAIVTDAETEVMPRFST